MFEKLMFAIQQILNGSRNCQRRSVVRTQQLYSFIAFHIVEEARVWPLSPGKPGLPIAGHRSRRR
jgi:hypothetical protein